MIIAVLLFGNCDLGDKRFAVRESAQVTLAKYWPLTEPLLKQYRVSTDLEVKTRAYRATPVDGLRFMNLGLTGWAAHHILYDVGDCNNQFELPWMPQETLNAVLRDKVLFKAIKNLANKNGLLREGEVIWYGSTTNVYCPNCDIDRLRFRAIGLGQKAWLSGSYTDPELTGLLKEWEKRFVQTPYVAR